MNYIYIFIFKIIEDSLATLRLILVSNGKKLYGAILQLIVTVIWILLTGYILIDFKSDIFKIFSFTLGSLFGSYIGSLIEEKIALGTNKYMVKSKNIKGIIKNLKYEYLKLDESHLIIFAQRKNKKEIIKTIKENDKNAMIILEKIKDLSNNHI